MKAGGGSGMGPAGINATTLGGGSGMGPAGMKPGGGSGMGPAGMKPGGGSGMGPAGINATMLGGGSGMGPAGIAFAVHAVTTSSARTTTFMIFNVPGRMENSPGGDNPPYNFAKKEYPNRVMESTTKVSLRIFFHLSNRIYLALVTKIDVTSCGFAPPSPDKGASRSWMGLVLRDKGGGPLSRGKGGIYRPSDPCNPVRKQGSSIASARVAMAVQTSQAATGPKRTRPCAIRDLGLSI
jgi:hypothetical protein